MRPIFLRRHIKKLVSIIVLVTIVVTGCSVSKKTEYPLLPYPPVVVWDSKAYVLTLETISHQEIGESFGEVKRYIEPSKAFPEVDGDSTIAKPGSKLFSIQGSDLDEAFAVMINGEYRLAVYSEP